MLRKCHGHGLTKGAIIQIFYHGLDEPTQRILNKIAEGIFLYKSPNQAFQFLDDKVLFKLNWSTKSKNKHHQKSIAFPNGSNSNYDNSRLMEKLETLTIKIEFQFISLKEELQDMRNKYNEHKYGNSSKKRVTDDTPMCECHEANYIQSEGYQNRYFYDPYSHQSLHDSNDSEKSLTDLNNDLKNDLEDFKRCVRSMRTIHSNLYERDNQSKIYLEKTITKFLDSQRVANMYVKKNVNDMIIKMKQNKNNFQTKIKNMERKLDEWSKSQNVSSEQTDRADPPPPQAQTEQVNAVFTMSGKSDDSPKIHKDPPPPMIVNNKTEKDQPSITSKRAIMWSKQRNIHSVSTYQKYHTFKL
ncbi:hypothetical protein Tco_1510951 [Tanacetum coccineum]